MIPTGFARVSRHERCRVCRRPDWCLRSTDGSDRAICRRVPSSIEWRCGWLHGATLQPARTPVVVVEDEPNFTKWEQLARECRTRLHEQSELRGPLAVRLGVSVESLDALDVGVLEDGAWTWPMRDHQRRTIGLRLRYEAHATKRAVRGSRNGLFLPQASEQDLVVVTEGESDCATALTLGFFAVGRPGCSGGSDLIVRWLARRPGRDVAIVADGDVPGIRGAAELAVLIADYARTARVVVVPRCWKDLRQAVLNGYTRPDLLQDIEAGLHVRSAVSVGGCPASSQVRQIELYLRGGCS